MNDKDKSKEQLIRELSDKLRRIAELEMAVNEWKKAEEKLREKEERLIEVQRSAHIGSWDWDINNNKESWSQETYRIFGVNPKNFTPNYDSFINAIHPDDLEFVSRAVEAGLEKGKPVDIDYRIRRPDGTECFVNSRGKVFRDKKGNLIRMAGTCQDITERKKIEVELRESEEKYRKLIETANDAILLADSESGIILDANKKTEELFGIPLDIIKGMHQTELHPEEERENYREIFKEHVKKENAFISDLLVVHKSGRTIPVDISASIIEVGGKKVLQGVFRDITQRKAAEEIIKKHQDELELRVQERTLDIERINDKLLRQIHIRKEAQEALKESEMRFRVAATTVTDLLWEGDVRDDSLKWHGDIDRSLGYDEGEFPRTISGHMESIHPDDSDQFIKCVEKALETGSEFRAEYRIKCKDGSYRYWDETGKAVEYEDGKAVKWIGSVTDITERKEVEGQIIKSQEQFKKLSQEFNALLDSIPDNIVLLDNELKILWANRASTESIHYPGEMLKGKHCYTSCFNLSTPCENCPVRKSFISGKEETLRKVSPSGSVWDLRAFPIYDETGNVKNVIEVARDITARVKLEQEASAIQEKLIHTNKMTSLGTLVSGVAHEINNPNSFIMTNADLFGDIWKDAFKLLHKLDDEYKHTQVGGMSFSDLETVAPKLLRGMHEGSQRIKNIVDNLREFARSDKGDLDETVDVNEAVRAVSNILDSHIKKFTDHYYLSCRDNIPCIKGNCQKIEQVIINLMINSLQALPDRNCCVIVSTYYDNKNDQVIIKVEDEGTGISESHIERITEPFFTTKMESGGTGLGLSISYAIIKEHNGSLEFTSEINKRTEALVKLPACSDDRND